MNGLKIAAAADKLAATLAAIATDLRAGDAQPAVQAAPQQVNRAPAPAPRAAAPTMVTVNAADLWLLVNRARKMIRLAREGKVPNIKTRNPLSKAIKTLKRAGAIHRPDNYKDL